jgi:hypothetical protein
VFKNVLAFIQYFFAHFFMLCKAKIDSKEVLDHFCTAIFTLKFDSLQALYLLGSPRNHPKNVANSVHLYLTQNTIRKGGIVFAVFDLG